MRLRKDTDQGRHGAKPAEEVPDNLTYYITWWFVLVLFLVMAAESLVVRFESLVMLPALREAINNTQVSAPQEAQSLLRVLWWLWLLLRSMARADFLQVVGLARGSLALLMMLVMLFLLLLPPLLGALGLSHVIARKMRVLQERRERELAQIDQQRSEFITDIAHDLRTPLMAISGMAHAISDGVVPDDAMRDEYLRAICDKADKMSGLVSSVFEYTKLGSGSYSLERTTVDLPQLLLREAAVAYTDIEEASMTFLVQVPEDRCMIDADQVQLARVVANLLTNAVRHNTAGTEIALLLVRRAGTAYVVVADTGDAIEGNPDDLFQPFSRGDKARSESGGSGLGLSICKRIAQMHGYDLTLVQPYGRFAKAFVLRCDVIG